LVVEWVGYWEQEKDERRDGKVVENSVETRERQSVEWKEVKLVLMMEQQSVDQMDEKWGNRWVDSSVEKTAGHSVDYSENDWVEK
jgi:hypothetical protein